MCRNCVKINIGALKGFRMSIKDQIYECVMNDKIASFERLLAKNDINLLLPIILEHLYSIAMFSSLSILNKVLELNEVQEHLENNLNTREHLFFAVITHSTMPVINRILELPIFVKMLTNDPCYVLLAAAKNRSAGPDMFEKMKLLVTIDDYITANNNQIWLTAHIEHNYAVVNKLLELFPAVFEYVDSVDPRHSSGQDYINTRFMEYYFTALNTRIDQWPASITGSNIRVSFDVGANEAKLCYLMLKTLIRTYADREKISNKVKLIDKRKNKKTVESYGYGVFFINSRHMPSRENIHLSRIKQLLAIPSVRRKAADNENQLLKMALSLGDDGNELVTVLRRIGVIRDYEAECPVNLANNKFKCSIAN